MPNVILASYGQPLTRVEKKADETILYTIDVSSFLDNHEVIVSMMLPSYVAQITNFRSRKGKFIEVFIPAINLEGAAAYQDNKVNIVYTTNYGNTRTASFMVRCYK
jgi:hypothetical protein